MLALIIGLFVGLMRVSRNPIFYAFSTLYVEVVRGIPLLVILLYAGFVVSPQLRDNTPIKLSDEWEAIIGLSFGYGAFIAEIFRAGIQSINRGQMEAARSLGMNYFQAMLVQFAFFGAYFVGSLLNTVYETFAGNPNTHPVVQGVAKVVTVLLPNFANYNIQNPIINPGHQIENEFMYSVWTGLYGAIYIGALMVIAIIVFDRREV
jgi:His/Glu/Gln/Arg/opine family amino acid ABC transporter permease subunit